LWYPVELENWTFISFHMPFSSFSDIGSWFPLSNLICYWCHVICLQNGSGHVGLPFVGRPNCMTHDPDPKNQSQSPRSVFGIKSGHNCEVWFILLLQSNQYKCYNFSWSRIIEFRSYTCKWPKLRLYPVLHGVLCGCYMVTYAITRFNDLFIFLQGGMVL
jgi:hypothetical protein